MLKPDVLDVAEIIIMSHVPKKNKLDAVDAVVVTCQPMQDALPIKYEKKIQGIRVTYNISYAESAQTVKTNLIMHTDTPQTPSTINKPKEEQDQIKVVHVNHTQNNNKRPIYVANTSTANASTQTESIVGTQIDPAAPDIKNPDYLF